MNRSKATSLKPLRLAIPFIRPYVSRLVIAFIFLTLASVSLIAMPVAIRYVIDFGFSNTNVNSINKYFTALLVLAIFFALFVKLRYYLVMWMGERVVADIRYSVYKHIIKMSPTFFEVTRTGDSSSSINSYQS